MKKTLPAVLFYTATAASSQGDFTDFLNKQKVEPLGYLISRLWHGIARTGVVRSGNRIIFAVLFRL